MRWGVQNGPIHYEGNEVVMIGSAADPQAYQSHVRKKQGMDNLAKWYRDEMDGFQLVIVRDMWLTGFD